MARPFVRLWSEKTRLEQLMRFRALRIQTCDQEGFAAWQEARLQHTQLPEDCRVDLPRPRVFARVLGLFRTAAQLKQRPMQALELSAQDMAELLGYSKSTIEAALRWLSSGPIEHMGIKVAQGLGWLHRARRTAKAFIEGVVKNVYRTSRTVLTFVGRGVLSLVIDVEDKPKAPWLRRRASAKEKPPAGQPEQQTFLPTAHHERLEEIRKIRDALGS